MNNMLSNKGFTSSEANHITNVTKELVKGLSDVEMPLQSSIVIKGNVEYPLDENKANSNWIKDIKRVGELYSLSAWLKSGVKLKENLLDDVSTKSFQSNTNYPELEPLNVLEDTSFEAYLNTLSIKERNEYLSSESIASHIGKFIHNFDGLRKAIDTFRPTSFETINGETVTIKNRRLYTKDELLNGFFDLQKDHRESENIVNLYKARHKEWQKELYIKYTDLQKEVNFKNSKLVDSYNQFVETERLEFEKTRKEKMAEISNLKIVIPNELQEILDFVNEYAKK